MVKTIKAETYSLGELQGCTFLLSLSALNEQYEQRTSIQALLPHLYHLHLQLPFVLRDSYRPNLCGFSSHLTTAVQKRAA